MSYPIRIRQTSAKQAGWKLLRKVETLPSTGSNQRGSFNLLTGDLSKEGYLKTLLSENNHAK